MNISSVWHWVRMFNIRSPKLEDQTSLHWCIDLIADVYANKLKLVNQDDKSVSNIKVLFYPTKSQIPRHMKTKRNNGKAGTRECIKYCKFYSRQVCSPGSFAETQWNGGDLPKQTKSQQASVSGWLASPILYANQGSRQQRCMNFCL